MIRMETAWTIADQLWRLAGVKSWLTWLIEMYIHPEYTVLDLGCGNGYATSAIACKKMVGVDAWEPAKDLYHSEFILGDIRNITRLVEAKSFDVVLCLDVIEHLEQEDAHHLLKNVGKIAKERSIIFTPSVFTDNQDHTEDPKCWAFGNEFNIHKSLWTVADLEKYHYDAWKPGHPSKRYQYDYVVAAKDHTRGLS